VGAGGEVAQADVLDLLTHLVEKSLVVMEVGGERYRMLDTVRHYAQERMSETADSAPTRTRHLDFYLKFAETARPELAGPEQGQWLARLDLERENMLSAHEWSAHAEGGAELALRMVHALRPYWKNRGLMMLGHRLATELLTRAGFQRRDNARCRALFGLGQLCHFMGRYRDATNYLAESLAIAREMHDDQRIAMILQPLGMACLGEREFRFAHQYLEEAVTLANNFGNRRELAAAQNALAMLHRMEGRFEAAQPLYERVVESARELGDRESIAIGLLNLAMVSITRGSEAAARPMLLEVLEIAAEIGSKPAAQSTLEVCTGLAAALGDWEEAAHFFGAAEALTVQTGLKRDPADEEFLAPLIARTKESLNQTNFDERKRAGQFASPEQVLLHAHAWLASEVRRNPGINRS
jgi:tetratricopeptide (TPR) repeat protein